MSTNLPAHEVTDRAANLSAAEARDIRHLAAEVRRLYWLNCRLFLSRVTGHDPGPQERRAARWDAGEDRYGKRHQPIWPKLARHYLEAGADPATALQAALRRWDGPEPPIPNKLLAAPEQAARRARAERVIVGFAERLLWRKGATSPGVSPSPAVRSL